MKTIKEEIEQYQLCASMDIDAEKEINEGEFDVDELIEESIYFGIELAQRWIPVKKEFPTIKKNESDFVLSKDRNGDWYKAKYQQINFQDCWIDEYGIELYHIISWRPIERS
jgi:arginine/lysine/ornithine decarboxylase